MDILGGLRKLFSDKNRVSNDPLLEPSYVLGKRAGDLQERMNFHGAAATQSLYDSVSAELKSMLEEGTFNFDNFDAGFDIVMEHKYSEGWDFLFLKPHFPEKFAGMNEGFVQSASLDFSGPFGKGSGM